MGHDYQPGTVPGAQKVESSFASTCSALGNELAALHDRVAALDDRLAPVTRSKEPAEEKKAARTACATPAIEMLTDATERVAVCSKMVGSILDRCCL